MKEIINYFNQKMSGTGSYCTILNGPVRQDLTWV
jgi:hypothetical protein